jgi:hypothetical protein
LIAAPERLASRRQRWLLPAALWLAVIVVLVLIWRACWNPGVVRNMPGWFLRIADLTGSVLYDDPALALRIQVSRWMVIAMARCSPPATQRR